MVMRAAFTAYTREAARNGHLAWTYVLNKLIRCLHDLKMLLIT